VPIFSRNRLVKKGSEGDFAPLYVSYAKIRKNATGFLAKFLKFANKHSHQAGAMRSKDGSLPAVKCGATQKYALKIFH